MAWTECSLCDCPILLITFMDIIYRWWRVSTLVASGSHLCSCDDAILLVVTSGIPWDYGPHPGSGMSCCTKWRTLSIVGLVHKWGESRVGDWQTDWLSICSDVHTVTVCCGKERYKCESKAVDLPVDPCSYNHPWMWICWKYKYASVLDLKQNMGKWPFEKHPRTQTEQDRLSHQPTDFQQLPLKLSWQKHLT